MASNQAPEASKAQLWSNEGLLRAAFENSIDGILITSPDGRIHAANPQACRILQMTEREICEHGRDNLVDLADPRVPGLLQERARTGRCQGEVTMRRKGATQFEAEISSSVFREQGLERAINIFRDISERKQLETILRESEARFRLTFDQSPIGAAIVSLDYHFLRVNEHLCRMTGYTEAELMHLSFPAITHPEDLELDLKSIKQLEQGEIEQYSREKRYLRKDGTIVWGRLAARILKDPAGRPLYFLAKVENISERKQAEQERERLIEQLQEALQKIKTLTGLLPICAHCKKIRDDKGNWTQFENYISERSHATFSHSVCPVCMRQFYPQIFKKQNP